MERACSIPVLTQHPAENTVSPRVLPQLRALYESTHCSSLVLETSCRIRRKTGRAYSGRAFFSSLAKVSKSQELSGSAMAAIPAFPSIPKRHKRRVSA